MNREFSIGLILGWILFAMDQMLYFVHLKSPFIMMIMTLMLGLTMVNLKQSLYNFLGFTLAYFVGSFVMMHASYGSIYGLSSGFQLRETLKMFVYENNTFMLWLIGFPVGFCLRHFMEEEAPQPKKKAPKKPKEFGTKENRPMFLALRDQPGELHTSPSIHLN